MVGEAEIMCEILSRPDWYWMDDDKRPVNTDVNVCQGQPAAIQMEIHPPKDYQWQYPAGVEMQVVPGERAGTMEDLSSGIRHSPPLPYRINAHEAGQTIFSLNYHALSFDERLNVGYEQLTLNAVEYLPDSSYRPKPSLAIRVTGPQRVVNIRLIAPTGMAMNEQLVLGTVGVINTIYKQAGIRFVLRGGQIERVAGMSTTFSAKNATNLTMCQSINRQTPCATIFFATDIYNNDNILIPGVAVSHHGIVGGTIGAVQEKLAYAVVKVPPVPIAGAIGETMAHELGHVIATLGDSSNKSCLMYQVGRDADNLNAAEVYWLRHPPVGGVDKPPPANKSRFFAN